MFLKNKNIIFKIRRSKVTDYAALREQSDLGPYCLQNRLQKYQSKCQREQTTIVVHYGKF